MACEFNRTRPATVGCGGGIAGLDNLKLRLISRANITFGAVSATTGVASTFTVAVGKQLYPFVFEARQHDITSTGSLSETGAFTYLQAMTGRFPNLSGKSRADAASLAGTELVAILKTREGKYLVYGYTAGLTLTGDVSGASAAALGHTITIGNTEDNPESANYFELLSTDEAATEALLLAAEEPAE